MDNRSWLYFAFAILIATVSQADQPSRGVDSEDKLLQIGLLDVTKAPYFADPTGEVDATESIQRAVNDARDHWLVCYFPDGTYLISDTISCEQKVSKLDRPRSTDGHTQHYWNLPNRIVMIGSTKGRRPVLKLSADAKGFDDPQNPKLAVWVWAQTRDDAPGKQEPIWGKEQPNISFSHIFKGIDIDIRGHRGAIGIRHSGSQGSTLQDVTVQAEGAYAGLSNCCGQGGGTYNVEVIGGRYGITIDRGSRFPLLVACVFRDQTDASVSFVRSQSNADADGGVCDAAVKRCRSGSCEAARWRRNQFGRLHRQSRSWRQCLPDAGRREYLSGGCLGAGSRDLSVTAEPSFQDGQSWTRIKRYSASLPNAVRLINGVTGSGDFGRFRYDDGPA